MKFKKDTHFKIVLLFLVTVVLVWGVIDTSIFQHAWLTPLVFVQNIVFALVSRSRNRDNADYHAYVSMLSHGMWYFVFKQLFDHDMPTEMIGWYVMGSMSGSIYGIKVSMRIEKWLGASADAHIKLPEPNDRISEQIEALNNSTGPGPKEDGYVVTWDNSLYSWVLKPMPKTDN